MAAEAETEERPQPVGYSTDAALDQIIAELEAAIRAPAAEPVEPVPALVEAAPTLQAAPAFETAIEPEPEAPAIAALARLNAILTVLEPEPEPEPAAAVEDEATPATGGDPVPAEAEPAKPESGSCGDVAPVGLSANPAATPAMPAAPAARPVIRPVPPSTGTRLPAASPPRLVSVAVTPRARASALSPALHPEGSAAPGPLPGATRRPAWATPDRRAERLRQTVIAAAALLPACAIAAAAFWGGAATPAPAPAPTLAMVPLEAPAPPVAVPPPAPARAAMPSIPASLTASGAVLGGHRAGQDLPEPSAGLAAVAGILPDDVKALEISAKAGNAMAQHDLGARYAAGRGVGQDYGEAVQWFSAAARQGVANAAYNLGVLYQQGLGVSSDAGQAVAWYRQAAEAGHAEAQYNLGVALIEGHGVPADSKAAVRWLTEAEGKGVAQAAFNLGVIAELGLGGEPDSAAAARWYGKAAAAGDMQAAAAIARLRNHEPGEPAEDFAKAEASGPIPGVILASTAPLPPRKPADPDRSSGRDAPPVAAPAPAPAMPPVTSGRDRGDDTPGGFVPPDNHDMRPPSHASAEDIKAAQQILARLGYNPGPADGKRDSQTMEAIVTFQRDAGLPIDGEVSDRLLERLIQAETRR